MLLPIGATRRFDGFFSERHRNFLLCLTFRRKSIIQNRRGCCIPVSFASCCQVKGGNGTSALTRSYSATQISGECFSKGQWQKTYTAIPCLSHCPSC